MNTNDKIALIKDAVVKGYKSKTKFDDICISLVNTEGIVFSEIPALVKAVGVSEGFIVKIADRKADFEASLSIDGINTWSDVTEYHKDMVSKYDVPSKWAMNKIKGAFVKADSTFPLKQSLTEWQEAMISVIEKHGKKTTQDHFVKALTGKVKTPKSYATAYGLFALKCFEAKRS